jgi:DNA-binding transcriptional ArsR family regulator
MPDRRPQVYRVSRIDQLEALASPVRHEIFVTMETLSACTVRELARRMGRQAETLYYHLGRLEAVGLVHRRPDRVVDGRPERVYELAGHGLVIDRRGTGRAFLAAVARASAALLRFADRSLRRAVEAGELRHDGARRSTRAVQRTVRLSPPRLAELNDRLDELEAFLDDVDDPSRDDFHLVTIVTSRLVDR